MPSQSIEIIKNVLAFDKNSKLVNQKTYSYSSDQKREILLSIERNGSNLMLDNKNERYYKEIAVRDSIHCKINGITY